MKNNSIRTHRVAVTAYVLNQNKFLLLKRNTPPLVWAPPGGRLAVNEHPLDGLHREVREETGLTITVCGLVDVWFGELPETGHLLSIDYLAVSEGQRITLSREHVDFAWLRLEQLRTSHHYMVASGGGFSLADFEKAYLLAEQRDPE